MTPAQTQEKINQALERAKYQCGVHGQSWNMALEGAIRNLIQAYILEVWFLHSRIEDLEKELEEERNRY